MKMCHFWNFSVMTPYGVNGVQCPLTPNGVSLKTQTANCMSKCELHLTVIFDKTILVFCYAKMNTTLHALHKDVGVTESAYLFRL